MVLNDEAGYARVLEGADQGLREPCHHCVNGRSQGEPDGDCCNQCERQASKEHLRRVFHEDSWGSANLCAHTIHSEIPAMMTSDCQTKIWASLKCWGRKMPM